MYKYLVIVFLVGILKQAPAQTGSIDSLSKGEEWVLHFNDEFNDSVLDTEKWFTWFPYTDDGSDQCAFCRTHGNESQVFMDRNVVIIDSVLHIVAKKEEASWFGQERDHTSGMIHSKFPFGMGYYEIRAKLPAGKGFWPGIWTFGQISAEIDIMEAGMQKPKRFHTSVHNWEIKEMKHKRHKVKHDLSEGFHTYAMEWDSTYIKFFIDGEEVWQLCKYANRRGKNIRDCNNDKGNRQLQSVFPPDNEKLYMIVGMGIGNETTPFTKSPDEQTVFPNSLQIDYIRIYLKKQENQK